MRNDERREGGGEYEAEGHLPYGRGQGRGQGGSGRMDDGNRQVGRGAVRRDANNMRRGPVGRRGGSRGQSGGLGVEGEIARRVAGGLDGEERNQTSLVCESWLEVNRVCTRTGCWYEHPRLCYGSCNNRNCDGLHKAEARKLLENVRRERDRARRFRFDAIKNNHCMKYLRGFCADGSSCKWVHPEMEVAPWIRDQGSSLEPSREVEEGERDLVVESDGHDSEYQDSEGIAESNEGDVGRDENITPAIDETDSDPDDILKYIREAREEMGDNKK